MTTGSAFGPSWFVSPWNLTPDLDLRRRIIVHDTTLRDGEQQAGIVFTPEQKIAIAASLDDLGVDRLEVGMIGTGSDELAVISRIAAARKQAEIWAIVSPSLEHADMAIDSGVDGVGVVLFANRQHRKVFGRDLEQSLESATETAARIRSAGKKTTLLLADAPRFNVPELARVVSHAAESGAFTGLALMDTFGSLSPAGAARLVATVRTIADIPLEFHGHNDFGLAVANSLSAFCAGASAIHATMLGLGERVGNTALEELILSASVLYRAETQIDLGKLTQTARIVRNETHLPLAPHKPVVGDRIYDVETAGITGQMAKWAELREPMQWYFSYLPELVGGGPVNFVLGKGSGPANVEFALARLGLSTVSHDLMKRIASEVRRIARQARRDLTDAEFGEIVSGFDK